MVFLLILFLREDRMILNFSTPWNILLFIVVLVFVLGFSYCYSFRNKIKYNFITDLLGSLVLSFFMFIILKMSVNFWIEERSKNKIIEKEVLFIDNFISGRSNLIYFYFKDKRYSLKYNNSYHLDREELINDYNIEIYYSKSILDTYVIKKYNIVAK